MIIEIGLIIAALIGVIAYKEKTDTRPICIVNLKDYEDCNKNDKSDSSDNSNESNTEEILDNQNHTGNINEEVNNDQIQNMNEKEINK